MCPGEVGKDQKAGAITIRSLTEGRCPVLTSVIFLSLHRLSDCLLWFGLRIAGRGIPKALSGLRGVSAFERLGFVRCQWEIEFRLVRARSVRRRRGPCLVESLSSPLPGFSSVLGEPSGGKSSTPEESPGVADSGAAVGRGTQQSPAGGE